MDWKGAFNANGICDLSDLAGRDAANVMLDLLAPLADALKREQADYAFKLGADCQYLDEVTLAANALGCRIVPLNGNLYQLLQR